MSNTANTSTAQRFAVDRGVTVTNVTGNGTTYTTTYDTSNQGSGIVIGTGVFTCTVAGTFMFCMQPTVTGLTAAATTAIFNLVTTQRTYTFASFSAGAFRSQASVASMGGCVIAPMAAGDTASLTAQVSGTTLTIGFGNGCWFTAVRLF
jgi:hypothetical protein